MMGQMELFTESTIDELGIRSMVNSDLLFGLAMKAAGLRYEDDPRAFGGKKL